MPSALEDASDRGGFARGCAAPEKTFKAGFVVKLCGLAWGVARFNGGIIRQVMSFVSRPFGAFPRDVLVVEQECAVKFEFSLPCPGLVGGVVVFGRGGSVASAERRVMLAARQVVLFGSVDFVGNVPKGFVIEYGSSAYAR